MTVIPATAVSQDRHAVFVTANTRLMPVPLAPEISLHLACEALDLWHRTEEDLGAIGLPPPFWAFAWAGGQALARHLIDHPQSVAGRRVLDLGTGSGLVAIAAMKAGAVSAVAADPDGWACAAADLNALANGFEIEIVDADLLDGPAYGFDTLLIGDLFYDREIAPRVEAFCRRALERGAVVLIGDPGRSYLPKAGLTKLAEYGVPTTRALEDAEIKHTAVWRFDGT